MWKHVLYDKIEVTVEQDWQVSIIDNQVSSMRFYRYNCQSFDLLYRYNDLGVGW